MKQNEGVRRKAGVSGSVFFVNLTRIPRSEGIDLLQCRVSCECGVALIVAMISAIKHVSVQPALVVLGDMSIQGNIRWPDAGRRSRGVFSRQVVR